MFIRATTAYGYASTIGRQYQCNTTTVLDWLSFPQLRFERRAIQ